MRCDVDYLMPTENQWRFNCCLHQVVCRVLPRPVTTTDGQSCGCNIWTRHVMPLWYIKSQCIEAYLLVEVLFKNQGWREGPFLRLHTQMITVSPRPSCDRSTSRQGKLKSLKAKFPRSVFCSQKTMADLNLIVTFADFAEICLKNRVQMWSSHETRRQESRVTETTPSATWAIN